MNPEKINLDFNRPIDIDTSKSIQKEINPSAGPQVKIEPNTAVFQKTNTVNEVAVEEVDLDLVIHPELAQQQEKQPEPKPISKPEPKPPVETNPVIKPKEEVKAAPTPSPVESTGATGAATVETTREDTEIDRSEWVKKAAAMASSIK